MTRIRLLLACFVSLLVAAPVAHAQVPAEHTPSASYQWVDISLEATARAVDRDGARPTVLSRTVAIVLTAQYDAWAAYDARAVGTRLGGSLRRPPAERTLANKEKAIAYAGYRTLVDVYPADAAWLADQMRSMGFDPEDASVDSTTPQGVGNLAAQALISWRHSDGANQLGDAPGSNGKPYADYTGYTPVNPPDRIIDPNRWQPISFSDGHGGMVTPGFLTPHWYLVKPFALDSSDQFRPPPPPLVGSHQLARDVKENMDFNATLTPAEKALVEYMRDGPRSTGQSGHWLRLAQLVSQRDGYGLDEDVRLFFAVSNVAMDAFIAAWEAKRYYDTSRPWTLVRYYEAGHEVMGWQGPGLGVDKIPAEQWQPYSPSTFVTPPFPGYVSGHSTVSAACAKLLELFTGSDTFGASQVWKAGSLTEPDFACNVIQQRKGKPSKDTEADCTVTLELPTFSETAELAGISRVMGGYHIQSDNIAGLQLGRDVAQFIWPRVQAYFDGTAAVR